MDVALVVILALGLSLLSASPASAHHLSFWQFYTNGRPTNPTNLNWRFTEQSREWTHLLRNVGVTGDPLNFERRAQGAAAVWTAVAKSRVTFKQAADYTGPFYDPVVEKCSGLNRGGVHFDNNVDGPGGALMLMFRCEKTRNASKSFNITNFEIVIDVEDMVYPWPPGVGTDTKLSYWESATDGIEPWQWDAQGALTQMFGGATGWTKYFDQVSPGTNLCNETLATRATMCTKHPVGTVWGRTLTTHDMSVVSAAFPAVSPAQIDELVRLYSTRRVYNATSIDYAVAARACLESALPALKGANACASYPLFFAGGDASSATQHYADVIWGQPQLMVLQKDVLVSVKNDTISRSWYNRFPPCNVPPPTGMHCDEYPFYSATDGAHIPPAHLRHVTATHNTKIGSILGSFYGPTRCDVRSASTLGGSDGGVYAVIPIEGGGEAMGTNYICTIPR